MLPMTSKSPEVLRLARGRFGVGEWRGLQAEALDGVLAGQDLFVTMPTGSGKSLIFQLPALVLDGLTLVISPLIALMKDQVDALRERGVRARACTACWARVSGSSSSPRLNAASWTCST
jgi:ATP-dependent DNA helicase RecQ